MSRVLSRPVVVCAVVGLLAAGGLATSIGLAQQRAAGAMATAATAFLSSLTPDQKTKAVFPLKSDEWTRWGFIPVSMFPRNGLCIKDMTDVQRQRVQDLLKLSLSQTGYNTANATMQNETLLGMVEEAERQAAAAKGGRGPQALVRDPDNYFVSVFGEPSAKAGWGWRLEGHHASLHFAVENAKMTVTSMPMFFGANPAEVRTGPTAGTRILGAEEDTARALLASLDATQKAVAIIAPAAPNDIASGTKVQTEVLSPAGLPASQMTPAQRDLLMKVIDVYLGMALPEVAADRLAKIKAAGTENIAFAWAGSTEKRQRYHYRIQGPTFLIEHNNTQNDGNHIHSVWRDFKGDFGRDLLAEHMAAFPHPANGGASR